MSEIFVSVLLLFLILLVFGSMALAGFRAAPWVPTKPSDIARLLMLVNPKTGALVFDLGAGDGRLVVALARHFPVQVVGFEISILPYLVSKLRVFVVNTFFAQQLQGTPKILFRDFLSYNLSRADAIVCFLTPMAMAKLAPKFQRELKKGARVVSYVFPIKELEPETISKPSKKSNPIYVYEF